MAKIRYKQPDADAGRVIVDEQLERLEARLTSMYGNIAKEVQADLDKFLDKYKKADAEKQAMVEAGELTEKEYLDWRKRQIFRTNSMKAKIDDLTSRVVNADKQAMAMVNDQLPETYATSYNFGGYRGETMSGAAGFDYTQFTIINQDAVRTLATEDPDLIPWKADPDVEEDKKWNRKHVQEAVYHGITKGDSMDDVAKRLLPVVNMDKNAAIRTARTAVNGIENKGRKDATERVKEAGIPMIETWSCTHDNRTRDTHILLDGTVADDNGMFGKGILSKLMAYPGDPDGEPAEVYNCRCGLVSSIKGIDHSKDDELYAKMMEEEYFEDWVQVKEDRQEKEAAFQSKKEGAAERVVAKRSRQEEKPAEELPKESELLPSEDLSSGKRSVVQGEDITGTWERRSDKFDFEIDDVIDAQGFNGLPKVVSEEDFNKAVKESSFIAQRTYSAPTQEVLDSYRDQLYNGDWYVNCETGGAAYGQGMYVAGNTNGRMNQSIEREMNYYKENSFGDFTTVETMTVTPDFKTIDFKEIKPEFFFKEIENKYADDKDLMDAVAKGREQRAEKVRGNPFYKDIKTLVKDKYGDEAYDNLQDFYEEYIGFDSTVDEGVMATLLGYDGILSHEVTPNISKQVNAEESQHIVILNRSKVIIKEPAE